MNKVLLTMCSTPSFQCCELLDAVGVPYIQSQGEAESTCAALNAAGVGYHISKLHAILTLLGRC